MRSFAAALVLAVLAAAFVSGSAAADAPAPFTRLPDIVLTSGTAATKSAAIAANGSWAHTSSGGSFTVVGFYAENGVLEGTAGHGFLYPGAKPLPVGDLEAHPTAFSPDGKYLLAASGYHFSRLTRGSPWRDAHPMLAVLSVPDLKVVVPQIDGADPTWLGASTIAFRRGDQAYRLDVSSGAVTAAGVRQTAFGCTHESFSPNTPCKSARTSSLLAVDPGLTGWLVEDSCMLSIDGPKTTALCTPTDAFRIFELSTGKARTIASVDKPLDHVFDYVSPSRTRACFWMSVSDKNSFSCVSLPNGTPEVIIASGDSGAVTWLDDQRVLVARDSGPQIFDLAARTMTNIVGLPQKLGIPVVLPGGRRFAFARPTTLFVDLDAKTISAGPAGDNEVEAIPNDPNRVQLHPRGAGFAKLTL